MSAANLARRFYARAAATEGFGVVLDARTLRTPGGEAFAAPTRALAEAVAREWNAQGDQVIPASMPLTQLAFAAIDHTPARRAELSRTLARYIETDLVCHRAQAPSALVERQRVTWNPLVAWARERLDLHPPVVAGVAPAQAPPGLLASMQAKIGALDDFRLTALAQAITLSGSAIIGLALLEGRLDAAAAFAAAALDDLWSLETWGEDAEARARLERLRADLAHVGRFIEALA